MAVVLVGGKALNTFEGVATKRALVGLFIVVTSVVIVASSIGIGRSKNLLDELTILVRSRPRREEVVERALMITRRGYFLSRRSINRIIIGSTTATTIRCTRRYRYINGCNKGTEEVASM